MQNVLINIGLYLTYLLLIVTTIAAIFFPLYYFIKNIKKAKGGLMAFGILLLVFLISFIISHPDTGVLYSKNGIGAMGSKIIGGGIIATYFFMAGALITAVYVEIAKLFK